ncbi:TBC domain-containing protein [Cryptosporidium felis]|nr:TBC domain-containing protein [Cryptosporidium felis]
MSIEEFDNHLNEDLNCLIKDDSVYFVPSKTDIVNKLLYSWRCFIDNMNSETAEILLANIESYIDEGVFPKHFSLKSKIAYFYFSYGNPAILHLHIVFLGFQLSSYIGPVSTTYLLEKVFGSNNCEFSEMLFSLPVFEIQHIILLLSYYFIKINWNYVCKYVPGISNIYNYYDVYLNNNEKFGMNNSRLGTQNTDLPQYSIHLSSYWVLRDCIYIIFSLAYKNRSYELDEYSIDDYCGLLKDLTFQKTLLLTGPKLQKSKHNFPDMFNKERYCITSAIPLLEILTQFLRNSCETDPLIYRILSRISNRSEVDLIRYTGCNNYPESERKLLFNSFHSSSSLKWNIYRFPDYKTCIDLLLKGGEFLLVYPTPSLFVRIIKRIRSLHSSKIVRKDKHIIENDMLSQLKEFLPKVRMKLSKDYSHIVVEELSETINSKNTNVSLSTIGKQKKNRFRTIFSKGIRKKKIPIENIVSTFIGYTAEPDMIPLYNPNILRPCFCCNQTKFDEALLFYRTLSIQTKKKCYKFLSVNTQELCIKQWHAIIIQFIELKFSQFETNEPASKSLIKITKYRKNEFESDQKIHFSEVERKWYNEILQKWGTHWNCNSIPISVKNTPSTNNQLNRNKNEQGYSGLNIKGYFRKVINRTYSDCFYYWFFGSHWLNQSTSMHIFGSKPKISAIRSIQGFKGYSIENINHLENGCGVSNWINFLHFKLYSSYPLYSFPIIDRGVRFGAPNSKILCDLWSIGIPSQLRTKIWQIALGNETKISIELFNMLHLQNIYRIEKENDDLFISLMFRYALEIQSIFYNRGKKIKVNKNLSSYVDRKREILNISASYSAPHFFLKQCGFAKEWDFSSFKIQQTDKSKILIDTNQYFIDFDHIFISKRSFDIHLLDWEPLYQGLGNSRSKFNTSKQLNIETNSTPSLGPPSIEAIDLGHFEILQGNSDISVNKAINEDELDSLKQIQWSEYPSSNLIIKGLLDTIGALMSHSPSIGFQPRIIGYLSVFLMYMEPPAAFKCMLNLLRSFDFLIDSADSLNISKNKFEVAPSISSLDYNEGLLSNSQYFNNLLHKGDNIWILISHIFQSFVYSKLPHLYQHLVNTIGIGFENIVIPWFRDIFMSTLSLPIILIIWDNFLLLGLPLLFQAGLSLLKICEPQLLKCGYTIDALNLLLNNSDYSTFVIKPELFTLTLRRIQRICDITEITSIISQYKLLEQKRWIIRSQQEVKNYLISHGYYCTSTPNTPKTR